MAQENEGGGKDQLPVRDADKSDGLEEKRKDDEVDTGMEVTDQESEPGNAKEEINASGAETSPKVPAMVVSERQRVDAPAPHAAEQSSPAQMPIDKLEEPLKTEKGDNELTTCSFKCLSHMHYSLIGNYITESNSTLHHSLRPAKLAEICQLILLRPYGKRPAQKLVIVSVCFQRLPCSDISLYISAPTDGVANNAKEEVSTAAEIEASTLKEKVIDETVDGDQTLAPMQVSKPNLFGAKNWTYAFSGALLCLSHMLDCESDQKNRGRTSRWLWMSRHLSQGLHDIPLKGFLLPLQSCFCRQLYWHLNLPWWRIWLEGEQKKRLQ